MAAHAIDAGQLLPAEQAFRATVAAGEQDVAVQFQIADGYYLYQEKIHVETEPSGLLGAAEFSLGKEKEDEFFGKQTVHYHQAVVKLPFQSAAPATYRITLSYQGCADAGVCYPPVTKTLEIKGTGVYGRPPAAATASPRRKTARPQPAPCRSRAKARLACRATHWGQTCWLFLVSALA